MQSYRMQHRQGLGKGIETQAWRERARGGGGLFVAGPRHPLHWYRFSERHTFEGRLTSVTRRCGVLLQMSVKPG